MHSARLAGLLIAVVLSSGCGDGSADESTSETNPTAGNTSSLTLPVVGQEVIKGDLVLSVNATGTLQSEAAAILKAEATGTVAEVLVRPGQRVVAGQELVKLDPEPFLIELDRAKAALATAEVRYRVEIVPDSIASGVAPSEARKEFARASAGIETAQIQVREAEINLRRSVIRAPFAGTIERIPVSPGERIGSGQEMAMLVDMQHLRLNAIVLQNDIPLLKVGGDAEVMVPAVGGDPVAGKIAAVLPVIDTVRRSGTALVRLNGDGVLRPGMYANVRLEASRLPDRIIVPTRSIVERDGRPLVFVVREGIAEWVYIQAGRSNGRQTEVLPDSVSNIIPLKPGDVVLVNGHLTLSHQAPVRLVTPETEQ